MKKILIALATLATLALNGPSRAADFDVMEKDGVTVVTISGRIAAGDARVFDAITRDSRKVIVGLQGPGGLLSPALAIGASIRSRGYATIVGGRDTCASACGFIWLAGSTRLLSPDAMLGLHAAYNMSDDGTRTESGVGNARIGAYLTMLGLPLKVVDFATTPGPDSIARLTPAKAKELGIDIADAGDTPGIGHEQAQAPEPTPSRPPAMTTHAVDPSVYERAAKNFDATYRKAGISGVNAAIRQCYDRALKLRTPAAAAYCVALDAIASSVDIAMSPDPAKRDALTPFNRIDAFRRRSTEAAEAASVDPGAARTWSLSGMDAFSKRLR